MIQNHNKPKLAYILAASHSGSTLLARILSAHPHIFTVGELKIGALEGVDSYRCSCRRRIIECPFWCAVKSKMGNRGRDFSLEKPGTDIRVTHNRLLGRLLRPMHRGKVIEFLRDTSLNIVPGWRAHLTSVQKQNSALLEVIGEITGAKIVVDSSKVGIRLKYLLQNDQIDLSVIRLVRDGRGVALTYVEPHAYADAKAEHLRGGGRGSFRTEPKMSFPEAATEWYRANVEAESIIAELPSNKVVTVKYEELCTAPARQASRVARFLGLVGDVGQQGHQVGKHESHIIGNGMRFDDSPEIELDERWRSVLDADALADFDRIAGPLNKHYGYI